VNMVMKLGFHDKQELRSDSDPPPQGSGVTERNFSKFQKKKTNDRQRSPMAGHICGQLVYCWKLRRSVYSDVTSGICTGCHRRE
jgi:hypothetical protein